MDEAKQKYAYKILKDNDIIREDDEWLAKWKGKQLSDWRIERSVGRFAIGKQVKDEIDRLKINLNLEWIKWRRKVPINGNRISKTPPKSLTSLNHNP